MPVPPSRLPGSEFAVPSRAEHARGGPPGSAFRLQGNSWQVGKTLAGIGRSLLLKSKISTPTLRSPECGMVRGSQDKPRILRPLLLF